MKRQRVTKYCVLDNIFPTMKVVYNLHFWAYCQQVRRDLRHKIAILGYPYADIKINHLKMLLDQLIMSGVVL